MTAFLIILGILLYIFIGTLMYNFFTLENLSYSDREILRPMIGMFYPAIIPILGTVLLANRLANKLKNIKVRIERKPEYTDDPGPM